MSDEYMLDDVVMELRDTLGMTEHADAVIRLRARLAAAESRLREYEDAPAYRIDETTWQDAQLVELIIRPRGGKGE